MAECSRPAGTAHCIGALEGIDCQFKPSTWCFRFGVQMAVAVPDESDAAQDEEGHVLHWFGTNTDITTQQQAEEALRLADQRKDEFIATLAHELRNPLAPIRNAVEIMRLLGSPSEKYSAVRDIIDRQTQHLTRLVDDLLEVSRFTQGKVELRVERVCLSVPVNDAVEAARPLIRSLDHVLSVSLPPQPIYLECDPTRITQVVLNLLNNAAKFDASRRSHLAECDARSRTRQSSPYATRASAYPQHISRACSRCSRRFRRLSNAHSRDWASGSPWRVVWCNCTQAL